MAPRALVTGAHGFIGRHVARGLAQAGWDVTGIGHGNWTLAEARSYGIAEWRAADVTPEALETIGNPDVIVHCAGSSSVAASVSDPDRDFARTVGTTAAILDFARRQPQAPRLVYASSAAVYGMTCLPVVPEDSGLHPVSPYGTHKKTAEELLRQHAARHHIPVAIVRLFSIFGPGLRKQLLWDACCKIMRHDLSFSGTGNEVRDWLHIDDAVALLLTAVDYATPDAPVVNGGTGKGTPIRAVIRSICNLLGRDGEPSFSGVSRIGDPPRYVADVSRASRWGWCPRRGLDEGLAEYVRWFGQRA